MSLPTIQINLTSQAEALARRVADVPAVLGVVAKEVDRQVQLTVAHITQFRLTGTGPFPVSDHKLGVRTGHLRRSLRATRAQVSGSAVQASIGTNVVYAGAHEFGFDGTVMVGGHVRKRKVTREFLSKTGRAIRKRVRVGDTIVGPHPRKLKIPARAPITTGIEDRVPAMGAAVSAAIVKHLGGQP